MRFDPRPRNPNGTLKTKMSREKYIKMYYGSMTNFNAQYNEFLKKSKKNTTKS